jgi:hypothetical protein
LLQTNPRHQGLKTHKYDEFKGPNKEQVFEAYVENDTSGAYRVFWCYKAPEKNQIEAIIEVYPAGGSATNKYISAR